MSKDLINQAVITLKQGGLVAFPTETVYGLGADAKNEAAIARIFAAKGRPSNHPLIVHIPDLSALSDWAVDISPDAMMLAKAFWPGPLTLILKKAPAVLSAITGGQATVGLRVPKHPVANALLQAFGGGIAAPSANQFTHISPTMAEAVREELGNKVDMILDGGLCEVGLESTIVDMTGDVPVILRPGMISVNDIEKVLKKTVLLKSSQTTIVAPGMHHLHYSPHTMTRLVNPSSGITLTQDDLPAAMLTYSKIQLPNIQSVEIADDPSQYAHDLYRLLRQMDHANLKTILIEAVPEIPSWDAIRDRIGKAAGSV